MDRAVFLFYRLVARLVCLLPLTVVFRFGWGLGAVLYWFAGSYRRLVLRNLGIAYAAEKSPAELRRLARRHFATLGANLFASIKLPTLSRAEIEKVVTVEGLETMTAGAAAGHGFVMVISHLGNWEMFAQLSPILFPCKVGTIYQALGNPHLDGAVRQDRARLGLSLFERKEGFSAATRFLREGGAVGVLVDQHAGDAGLWCPFFNRLASTSTLAGTLALRTGAWLVPAAVHTAGVARWRCVIDPPIPAKGQDAASLTTRINGLLETQINRHPEDWFWMHNRWKLPQPKFLLATYKRGLAATTAAPALQPFRILIRATNSLRHAVMTVPAVEAIKRGRPDAHVTILTPAKLGDFWDRVEAVDAVIRIASGESILTVARKIRRNFEVAIILPNSLRTGLEAWLAGIPRRVGYPGHRREWLLNQVWKAKKKKKAAPPEPPRHQVYHYLQLAEFVGADITGPVLERRRPLWSPRPKPVIGLCPGAEYGPAKRWLPERFAETMARLSATQECEWVLFGVAKDAPIGEALVAGFPGRVRNLIGQTTLGGLINELLQCDLLLTNDTGTMHLAAFLDVPTVSIFGSTEPALTGPLGSGHRVLRQHVECSPCFLRDCPLDFRCMKAVQVDAVVGAIEETLARVRTNSAAPVS